MRLTKVKLIVELIALDPEWAKKQSALWSMRKADLVRLLHDEKMLKRLSYIHPRKKDNHASQSGYDEI